MQVKGKLILIIDPIISRTTGTLSYDVFTSFKLIGSESHLKICCYLVGTYDNGDSVFLDDDAQDLFEKSSFCSKERKKKTASCFIHNAKTASSVRCVPCGRHITQCYVVIIIFLVPMKIYTSSNSSGKLFS